MIHTDEGIYRRDPAPDRLQAPDDDGVIEQKYVFVGPYADLLASWLDGCCSRDAKFAEGRISTLYYDTPSLRLYDEKMNSDYLKTKVRLRWYETSEAETEDAEVPCFLEVKSKIGARRTKRRVPVSLPLRSLRTDPFVRPEIVSLPQRCGLEMSQLPSGLLPMFLIQYTRLRFVEPETGARIALDTGICGVETHPHYFPDRGPVELPMGVLEVKGPDRDLPRSLRALSAYVTKTTFSKYATCWNHIMQPIVRI